MLAVTDQKRKLATKVERASDAGLAGGGKRQVLKHARQLPGISHVCYTARMTGAAWQPVERLSMSVDDKTVRRIAHLARIAVADDEVEHLRGEINAILAFVEQLSEVDVAGVEPMTSVTPMVMKKRPDVVTDGGDVDAVLRNAPATEKNYFLVPKVVE
jgi:aspartyl-tRNA(Asn)/glutamyl-tRNA(Gln) amidotransferase subunit C